MSDDYSDERVKRVAFPPWELSTDGSRCRRWTLRVPPGHVLGPTSLGEPLLEVEATLDPSTGIVEARAVARGDPMSDEIFYWASYRFLVRLDAAAGPLLEVQGTPRSWWQPFRPTRDE